ncbi:MAG: Maf family protein [Oscillospiraceae bacterium]|nr:Maf family protein [Oscillospiraceae bacterium]
MKQITRLILASQSPRRRDLLVQAGLTDFIIRPAPGEEMEAGEMPPAEAVREIARSKAHQVADTATPGELILAADTMVCLAGALLGKPRNTDEAASMLRRLSGARHTVYTGVAMRLDGAELTATEATDVFFRDLTDREISAYIATGEPMDKAGSYGLQGRAGAFVRRIEGDVTNVIGLPLYRVVLMAREMGVTLF